MSDTIENSTFELLDKINVNEYTKGKGQFTYLSWAWAVRELLKVKPKSTWRVHKFGIDENERPYMQTDAGCFVQVSLTVDGVTRSQIHPVLDNVNKTVMQPNAFLFNTSIQRCLAKVIALHGLGLYIYAGEDLPEIPELDDSKKASLIKLAGKVSSDRKNEISKLVNNNTINETNFKSSYGKLKRELEAKENE